jgi:transposase-like protein
MIGFAAQRLMELETDALCGCGHGARSESRTNQRNGYRPRLAGAGQARSNCAFRSCVAAVASPAS